MNGALTSADRAQLLARGIPPEEAERQLRLLADGPAPIVLDRPCTVDDGIVRLDEATRERLCRAAGQAADGGRVLKFVPASGAATRMFKDLIAALSSEERPSQSPAVQPFFERLDDFPFATELRQRAGVFGRVDSERDERTLLGTLLHDMRYAELPKALIPFHHHGPTVRSAFEEHLLESTLYARGRDGHCRSHFTVASEFLSEFQGTLDALTPAVERHAEGARLAVGFSIQHPATDTLALTGDGQPVREADGSLLLRPAGHGALLQNLQALDADLVVIKNIDNIVPGERSDEIVYWKRVLIGYATELQRDRPSDRPLRVCGVVRNEGEPGGAPFWVIGRDGRTSPQIVEASQVDLGDPTQQRIFTAATHFNPVDLVCAVRAHDGRPFDLQQFVDQSAVFISKKSHAGRDLIALERPGLWNGAMAGWHTVFVEVPASTFAPVKTVFDLLRPAHQSL